MRVAYILATLASAGVATAGPRPVAEASTIPDIVQTDPGLGLKTIGRSYCGPASVANTIAFLKNDPSTDLGDLVRKLASPGYMDTHPDKGTGASGLARGIIRALADLDIKNPNLTYHGWRSHLKSSHTGDTTATLDHFATAGTSTSHAWVNVGWYKHDPETATYTRTGGHWVTVVSSGIAADGTPAPDIVAIHDPSPRTGKTTNTQFVKLSPLTSGTITGTGSKLPRPANGHLQMTGDMVVKRTADLAIADALLIFHCQ